MTHSKAYERLLGRLAELHSAAVKEGTSPSSQAHAEARHKLECAVIEAKRRRQSSSAQVEQGFFRRRLTWLLAFPAAGLAAATAILALRPSVRVEIHPEPGAPPTFSAPQLVQTRNPCEHALRAGGNSPLIDDFEDGNPLIAAEEGRVALWSLFQDTEALGGNSTLVPQTRPGGTRTNRYAIHAQGGELRNWGAVIQISFTPACYDVSAYEGITFSARGPGRLYAGVREVRVVPPEYGGTCTKDCYNAHQKKVDLTSQWRTFSIKWSEMYQRGYNMPPLDPSKVNSLNFSILPGDTPFDVWLDDVKFLQRQ